MKFLTSIPSGSNPWVTEGSPLYPPREGSNPGHLWKAHRQTSEMLRQIRNVSQQTSHAVANTNSFAQYASPWFHPFKIYRFPRQARHYFENSDYRKLMVHTGNPFPSGPISYQGTNFSPFGYEYDFLGVQTVPPDNSTFVNQWPPLTGEIQPIDENLPWHEVLVPDDGLVYYFWTSNKVTDMNNNPIGTDGISFILFGLAAQNCLNLFDGTTVNDVSGGEVPDENSNRLMIGQAQVQDRGGFKYLRTIQYRINTESGGQASTGGGSVTRYTIPKTDPSTWMFGDYFFALDSTNVQQTIAKPFKLRNSIVSQLIDGNAMTYVYDPDFQHRTASDQNANLEFQVVTPRYLPGDTVFAVSATPDSGVTDSSKKTVTLQQVATAAAWARETGT